jgi:putative restriction endonuclease
VSHGWFWVSRHLRSNGIHTLGVAPGRYQAFLPVFITGWDANALKAEIAFGLPEAQGLAPPESRLLDAADIVADSHEMMAHAMVTNGIPLSKIHHAAFDAHLIGNDPDYRLHVSPQLLDQNDGPMLEGLKKLQGVSVHLPRRA